MSAPAGIEVSTETDPTPLVKIFAARFTRALKEPGYARIARSFTGSFALQSTKNPQSITIDVRDGIISICHGIQPGAKITIHLDFDEPVNARVDGLFRHPLLSMKVSRFLDFPTMAWTDAARQFWEKNQDYPDMPKGIKIHCTSNLSDDEQEILLGEDQQVSITGTADNISEAFSGNTVFVQSFVTGKLTGISSFEHVVVLSDVTFQMLLGDRK